MKKGILAMAIAALSAGMSPVGWVEPPAWFASWPVPRSKSRGAGRRPNVSRKIRGR